MIKKIDFMVIFLIFLFSGLVAMSGCIESSKGKMPVSIEIGEKYVDTEYGTPMLHQPVKITNVGKETIYFDSSISKKSLAKIELLFYDTPPIDSYVHWLPEEWSHGRDAGHLLGDILGGKTSLEPGESIENELLVRPGAYPLSVGEKEIKFKIEASYFEDATKLFGEEAWQRDIKEIEKEFAKAITLEKSFTIQKEDFENPELRKSR